MPMTRDETIGRHIIRRDESAISALEYLSRLFNHTEHCGTCNGEWYCMTAWARFESLDFFTKQMLFHTCIIEGLRLDAIREQLTTPLPHKPECFKHELYCICD